MDSFRSIIRFTVRRTHIITQGLTWASIEWAFRETINYWQPVTYLSHLIDFQLFGRQLGWHHGVSLFWHLLDTLLLYSLMRYLTGAHWKSAAVAAMFAVHPLHVEPVAWLASRKDVLSTFFLLSSIGAYCFWLRKPSPYRYSLMAVIFALGLMTKPSVTILPILLLALDYWPLGRWTRGRAMPLLMEKLPLFLLSGIIIALSLRSYETTNTIVRVAGARSAINALPEARSMISPFHYLKQIFWPAGLSVHYPYVRPILARVRARIFRPGGHFVSLHPVRAAVPILAVRVVLVPGRPGSDAGNGIGRPFRLCTLHRAVLDFCLGA